MTGNQAFNTGAFGGGTFQIQAIARGMEGGIGLEIREDVGWHRGHTRGKVPVSREWGL